MSQLLKIFALNFSEPKIKYKNKHMKDEYKTILRGVEVVAGLELVKLVPNQGLLGVWNRPLAGAVVTVAGFAMGQEDVLAVGIGALAGSLLSLVGL